MFNIKEIVDGLIETILDFPIMFLRTHALVASRGPVGPCVVALRANHAHSKFLRLRTTAFLQILILYVFSGVISATNGAGGFKLFANTLFVGILKLGETHTYDATFVDFLALFLAFYYSFYLVVLLFHFRARRAAVLIDACLFYSTLCVSAGGVFTVLLLGLINPIFSTTNEILIRTALVLIYLYSFGQLGRMFGSFLKLSGRYRYVGIAACGTLCFAVFIFIIWLFLGKEGVWPDLRI